MIALGSAPLRSTCYDSYIVYNKSLFFFFSIFFSCNFTNIYNLCMINLLFDQSFREKLGLDNFFLRVCMEHGYMIHIRKHFP